MQQTLTQISVALSAYGPEEQRFAELAHVLQGRFQFGPPSAQAKTVLHFTANPLPNLFRVHRNGEVEVSTWQSEGLAAYAGTTVTGYLVLCALLGLTQWRVLALNSLLIPEDLFHAGTPRCLFSTQPTKQEYAFVLENPFVCDGCADFYRCLGAEIEIAELNRVLPALNVALNQARF